MFIVLSGYSFCSYKTLAAALKEMFRYDHRAIIMYRGKRILSGGPDKIDFSNLYSGWKQAKHLAKQRIKEIDIELALA